MILTVIVKTMPCPALLWVAICALVALKLCSLTVLRDGYVVMLRCGRYARHTATAAHAEWRINVPLGEGHVHRQLHGGGVKGRLCESVRPVKCV